MIQIVIPTYQRADSISRKTLRYLMSQLIPAEWITLFVASEDEKQEYEKKVPRDMYGSIIVGVKGLAEQRNFISDFYPEGQILCQMDDDVMGLKSFNRQPLTQILERGKAELEQGCGLFGVLPKDDTRSFVDKMTYTLTHILGSFFMCKNDRSIRVHMSEKEDFERSILYFKKYGKIARYRGAGVVTRYNHGSGGLMTEGREERMKVNVEYLLETYPEYCKYREKKGTADLLLNRYAKGPRKE